MDFFYLFQWSGLTEELPPNVQILTLQEWDDGQLLLRLEHLYQPKEDEQFSQNVTIELDVRLQSFKLITHLVSSQPRRSELLL